jgi:Spy/CpxP family protein refolding chaperone
VFSANIAFSQMTVGDIKKGHYGSPEYRASQMDEMMKKGLSLDADQKQKVHDINLKYSVKVEQEVVKTEGNSWTKYRRLMKIQKEKDKEMQAVLSASQFEKYVAKRDELFWEGVKEFFF